MSDFTLIASPGGSTMRRLLILFCAITVVHLAHGANAVILDTPDGAQQPQLAVDRDSGVHLTFGVKDKVLYTGSIDGGATFSEPTEVATLDGLALGMRRGPRIAISEHSIVISAIGSVGEDGDGNLYAWHSTDDGATWQGPRKVNDVATSAREGLHAMAASQNGEFYCVWLDLRNKGTQIFCSRSNDGGQTWSKNRMVYESPDGTVCECCHPSVAVDASGRVCVMWRNFVGGNRDMYIATSSDEAESFAPAVKLGEKSWPLNACPMDGGGLAVSPDGTITTVWRREEVIVLTDDNSSREMMLGPGRQPWAAANQLGHFAVWLSGTTGTLYLANSATNKPAAIADNAKFPVIAAPVTGRGPVVVAWESGEAAGLQINVARVAPP
jgi:hypothetical protein